MTKLPPAPTYFHKPITALNAHGARRRAPRALPLAQLRGRDRHRHRSARAATSPPPRPATTSPATRSPTTTGCTTSATPTPARCCASRAPTRCARSVPASSTDWDFHGKRIRTLVNGDGPPGRQRPTRWSGTCTTSSPTSPARSRSCRATCCCRARRPTRVPSSRATSSRSRSRGSGALTNRIVAGPTPIRDDVGAQPIGVGGGALDGARRRLGVPRHSGRHRAPAPSTTDRRVDPTNGELTVGPRRRRGRRGQPRPPDRRRAGAVAVDVRGPLAARLVVEAGRHRPWRRSDGRRRRDRRCRRVPGVGRARTGGPSRATCTASPT